MQSAAKKRISGMVLCFVDEVVRGSIFCRIRRVSKLLYVSQFYSFFRTGGLFQVAWNTVAPPVQNAEWGVKAAVGWPQQRKWLLATANVIFTGVPSQCRKWEILKIVSINKRLKKSGDPFSLFFSPETPSSFHYSFGLRSVFFFWCRRSIY